MTKSDFLKEIENMADECEILFWDYESKGYLTPSSVDCDGVFIYLEQPNKPYL